MTSSLRQPLTVSMFVVNDMRIDSRVRREAAGLARVGHRVTVYAVATDATALVSEEEVDGFSIVRLPMRVRPVHLASGDPTPRRWFRRRSPRAILVSAFAATRPLLGGSIHFFLNWQLRWRSWSRHVLRRVEPSDVWHAHDFNALPVALACARKHGGRVIYDSHEIFREAGSAVRLPRMVRRLLRLLERRWANRCDAVIAVNDSVAENLASLLEHPAIHVVRNCAEPPSRPSPLRAELGLGDNVPIVMYHGGMAVGRGLDALMAAMEADRLSDAHLVLMGSGPLRPALTEQARRSPAADRIHFIAPVAPADVTTWVSGADIAAMPIEPTTLNHRLATPNKLFEAIAAGVPVVGPDFVEFRRIVLDESRGPLGVLYDEHSSAAIADAIGQILAMPVPERSELARRCRAAAADRWNWSREQSALVAIYDGLTPRDDSRGLAPVTA